MWRHDWENKITDPIIDLLWAGWNRLGFYGGGGLLATSPDPEVLFLASVILIPHEQRLETAVETWAETFQHLINNEKIHNIVKFIVSHPNQTQILRTSLATGLAAFFKGGTKRLTDLLGLDTAAIHRNSAEIQNGNRKFYKLEWILPRNPLLSLREFMGMTFRADILHQIALSTLKGKKALSLTNISSLVFTERPTAFRILKDLEACQTVVAQSLGTQTNHYTLNVRSDFGKMLQGLYEPEKSLPLSWPDILTTVLKTSELIDKCRQTQNEAILKSFLTDYAAQLVTSLSRVVNEQPETLPWQQTALKDVGFEEIISHLSTCLTCLGKAIRIHV